MKLFDCFLFYNELELLELRFETLYDVIDKFVIAEANKTFSGKQKEFNFENNKYRYEKYLDKIIYVKIEDSPEPISKIIYWNVEYFQRNCLMRGLENVAKEGDYILVSDADEILNPETLLNSLKFEGRVVFMQNLFYYYVNVKQNLQCPAPVLARYGTFKNVQEVRHAKGETGNRINNGGWHFSFLGGAERIRDKLSAYSEFHTYTKLLNNKDNINYMIRNQMDIFERKNIQFSIVEIDKSFPKTMNEFIKKYPYLYFNREDEIANKQPESFKRNYFKKKWESLRKLILKIILKIQKKILYKRL
jgi:beta-1,4-mannosyl-glycoprotein beta-1,4-N-acetylglucosaminyltransferase